VTDRIGPTGSAAETDQADRIDLDFPIGLTDRIDLGGTTEASTIVPVGRTAPGRAASAIDGRVRGAPVTEWEIG
jgi:hypothetical protein